MAEAADVPYLGDQRSGRTEARQDTLKFAEAALTDSKREGLLLAVRARWVALAVTAVTLPIVNPNWEVIYYVVMLGFFALIGWAQLKVGKVGRSPLEVFLIICDLALLTFLTIVPNPWGNMNWPVRQFPLLLHLPFDRNACLFVADGARDRPVDLGVVGHCRRLGLPATRHPCCAFGACQGGDRD